jgi:Ca-activated chloride channel family protein
VIGLVFVLLGTGFTFKTWRGQLAHGNRELEKGQPDAAIAAYQEGLVNAPDEPRVHYNLGNALYEKGDFAKAGEHFKKALDLGLNSELQSQAEYNLGNVLYRQGATAEAEKPEEAVKQYEASLEHYKNAIQANAKDLDAKYNYEWVKKKLDELKETMKDQEKQDQQQNDQKNDEKDQKKDQNGQNKDDQGNDQQDRDQQDDAQSKDQKQDESESKDQTEKQNEQKNDDQQGQSEDNQQDQAQTGTSGEDQSAGQQATGTEEGQGMTKAQALQLLEQFEGQGGQLIPLLPEKEDMARSHKDW